MWCVFRNLGNFLFRGFFAFVLWVFVYVTFLLVSVLVERIGDVLKYFGGFTFGEVHCWIPFVGVILAGEGAVSDARLSGGCSSVNAEEEVCWFVGGVEFCGFRCVAVVYVRGGVRW